MAIKKGIISMPKSLSPAMMPSQGTPRTGLGGKIKEFNVVNTYIKGQQTALNALPTNLNLRGSVNIVSCLETTTEMSTCQYTEEYEYICVGFTDGKVRLFHAQTLELFTAFFDKEISDPKCSVTSLQHRPIGKTHPVTNSIIATYLNGCVKCWNYNLNDCSYTIREKRQILGLGYHPRMPKFITYGDDAKIILYDEETRTQERVFQSSENQNILDGHTGNINGATFNPKSNHEFVTGGSDDTVQFWDTRQPNAIKHIPSTHIAAEGISVNPTGTHLLTCAWQQQRPLQLWDYATCKLITNIEPDELNSKLMCGKFLNPNYCVACGGEPNLIRLFDLRTNRTAGLISNFETYIQGFSIGAPVRHKKPTKFSITTQDSEERETIIRFNELQTLPRVAFVTGKKLFQAEFH